MGVNVLEPGLRTLIRSGTCGIPRPAGGVRARANIVPWPAPQPSRAAHVRSSLRGAIEGEWLLRMMQPSFQSRLRLGMVELWLAATVVLLLIAASSSLRSPSLLIHVGLINARGLSAVWATVLPAICGIAALMGLFQNRGSGPILSLLYSLFWLAILVGGMLAAAWNLGPAGIERIGWYTWFVGGVIFVTMVSLFLITTRWAIEHHGRHPESPAGS